MGLSDLSIGHQTILRALVLGEMPHDLADVGDTGRAEWMTLAEQSARYVHRIVAAEARVLAAARVNERAGLAVAAEAEILVVHQLGGGEAIMELGKRDVLGADARLLVGLLGGAPRQRTHVGQRRGAV